MSDMCTQVVTYRNPNNAACQEVKIVVHFRQGEDCFVTMNGEQIEIPELARTIQLALGGSWVSESYWLIEHPKRIQRKGDKTT